MAEWTRATDLDTLKRRKKLHVNVAGHDIALFYVGGGVYAMQDVCIHKKSRLSQGMVFKGKVICPGHQWAFDLETGWVDQWSKCQPTYPVSIRDGAVYVDPTPRVRDTAPAAEERFGAAN